MVYRGHSADKSAAFLLLSSGQHHRGWNVYYVMTLGVNSASSLKAYVHQLHYHSSTLFQRMFGVFIWWDFISNLLILFQGRESIVNMMSFWPVFSRSCVFLLN